MSETSVNQRKVAMIGCGFVGSATAFALMESGLFSEMVLIDADKNRAEGEALDISHGLPFARPMKIYAGDYDDIVDAAIIIVTAGANQKPDASRDRRQASGHNLGNAVAGRRTPPCRRFSPRSRHRQNRNADE